MNTNITIKLDTEEVAAIVALYVVNKLGSLFPMSQSSVLNLESDLCENIIPQISKSITLQIIDGEITTYYENPTL